MPLLRLVREAGPLLGWPRYAEAYLRNVPQEPRHRCDIASQIYAPLPGLASIQCWPLA